MGDDGGEGEDSEGSGSLSNVEDLDDFMSQLVSGGLLVMWRTWVISCLSW